MSNGNLHAFTKVELLITVASIAILGAIGLAAASGFKGKSQQARCISNLKQIAIAHRLMVDMSGSDYVTGRNSHWPGGGQYVPGVSSLREVYVLLAGEIETAQVFLCPEDARSGTREIVHGGVSNLTNRSISYFMGIEAGETRPQWILGGDRNLCSDLEGDVLYPADGIRTNALKLTASWQRGTIHRGRGNIGLADGSARLMTTKELLSQLRETGDTNNTVLLPKP